MYVLNASQKPQSHLSYRIIAVLTPIVYWPMVESSLGVVGACLPLLRPIFTDTSAKHTFSSLRAMLSFSSLRSNGTTTESRDYAKLEAGYVRGPQDCSANKQQAF